MTQVVENSRRENIELPTSNAKKLVETSTLQFLKEITLFLLVFFALKFSLDFKDYDI